MAGDWWIWRKHAFCWNWYWGRSWNSWGSGDNGYTMRAVFQEQGDDQVGSRAFIFISVLNNSIYLCFYAFIWTSFSFFLLFLFGKYEPISLVLDYQTQRKSQLEFCVSYSFTSDMSSKFSDSNLCSAWSHHSNLLKRKIGIAHELIPWHSYFKQQFLVVIKHFVLACAGKFRGSKWRKSTENLLKQTNSRWEDFIPLANATILWFNFVPARNWLVE